MPELPEVEVVRRGLADHVVNRSIDSVEVFHPRSIRRHVAGPADFAASLVGASIADVRRRGKYLWLALVDGRAVLIHLGMSGQLLVQSVSAADETHLRIRIRFADGDPELRFVDQRTFGGMAVTEVDDNGGPSPLSHIARDPLDPEFTDAVFMAALRRRRTGLKRALLDQSLVSGIGNIYADEALWHARLHYALPTETMTRPRIASVLDAVRNVMGAALKVGGTSFDQLYVNVNGESGYFDRALQVYGRADRPCPRCGTSIRREAFMNRSSYFCPLCQPQPRRPHW